MTADQVTPAAAPKTRKLILQIAAGALAGGIATYAMMSGLERTAIDLDDPSRIVALLTGLVLAVIGLFLGFGLIAPGPGSRLLNVEDADELREQRRPLAYAAGVMLLGGVALLTLAVAEARGAAGLLPAGATLVIAGSCFAAILVLTYLGRGLGDELMRALSAEAAVGTLYALLIIAAAWGMLAHLGYAGWITPLGLLAGLIDLQLLIVAVVVARRGLMAPR